MSVRRNPLVDGALVSRVAQSRDGQPLSYNRAPSADLAPWFSGIYITIVDAPADYRLECGLFSDAGTLRLQLRGDWRATTADGEMALSRSALYCGPQTRRMPVSVTGSFISIGAAMRPGIYRPRRSPEIVTFLDRLVPMQQFGADPEAILSRFDVDAGAEELAGTLEDYLREFFPPGAPVPDPLTQRFEALAYTDPSASVARFAGECGIGRRTLERAVMRDFGLSPKQVLRRARALDMASSLLGVADRDEAEDLALRYYDQSHLIHEFTELFGMSPGQFVARPQPLLTLSLESRQARRLEAVERLKPGAKPPWRQD